MSLKIWLPMNRDLRNQGLLNNTITNSGAIYSSDGKLGGCYVFDGVNDSLTVGNLSTMVDTDFSFACWFYKDEWGTKGYETIFGGSSGFELESKVSSTNSPVLKLYNWGGGSCTYELSKWNHIVFTRNATETKLYLNGELKATGTAGTIPNHDYFVGSWNSTTQQNFKGKMCDIRIYDHCLSEMEVKQLSQGLVLHYPLNRQGFGQENLILDSNGVFVSGLGSAAGSGAEFRSKSVGLLPIELNKTYTLSFNVKMILNTPSNKPYLLVYNTNYRGEHGGWIYYNCNNDLAGDYETRDIIEKKIKITFTPTSFKPGSYTTDNIEFYSNYGSSNWFEISNIKLEEGSIATPWCPNSSDALATTIDLNGTTEYDTSGYCNNGTWHGTHTNTSDTPKYAVSTTATGSASTYLEGPILPAEAQTAALWIKCKKSQNAAIFNDKTTGLQIGLLNSLLYMNSKTSTAGFTTTHWKDDEWNHVVVTYDGTTRKVYINGEAETQSGASNYYIHNADNCWLWNRSYNNSYPFNGSLSDFRIYATALSPTDVKSLYQNCATIDPDGTIRGQIRS